MPEDEHQQSALWPVELAASLAVLLICQFAKTYAPATRTIASSAADTSTTATSLRLDNQSLPANASDLLLKPYQQQSEIELVPIEQIKVGMRVPALNPEVTAEERATFKDPDPATWQLMELEHQKPDGGVLLISMLRPIEWIHQQGIHSGGSFQIDMPELGAKGLAKVLALKPCPEIQAGPGHVVLSTFAHPATHEILDVTIGQGEDAETIGVTQTHPFWSVQDQAFVPIGHLVAGSQVLTADKQTKTITSILPRPGPAQQVYNLEVNGEHVYYVGQHRILVHNQWCNGEWVRIARNDGPSLDLQMAFSGKKIHYGADGKAFIEEFLLNGVHFDRIDARGVLGEVKGDYGFMLKVAKNDPTSLKAVTELVDEAARQTQVSRELGLQLEWYVRQQDLGAFTAILREFVDDIKIIGY